MTKMPEITIKDISNKEVGKMTLPEEIFGIKEKSPLMHGAVRNFLANQRQGTHSTKTKGLVSGGGRKPWKQKGTGRARCGSSRSPIWRGGGTIFGPMPSDYSYSIPKKARWAALYAALSAKIESGSVIIIDSFALSTPKTASMSKALTGLGVSGSALVVMNERDNNVILSTRNIPGVKAMIYTDLHAYDVLCPDKVVITRAAIEALKSDGISEGGE